MPVAIKVVTQWVVFFKGILVDMMIIEHEHLGGFRVYKSGSMHGCVEH
jgi:hypothetical protein